MSQLVRCNRCGRGVYDLGLVEVTARYADCSVWRAPCCGAVVDDRGQTGWTNRKDYEYIREDEQHGRMTVDGRYLKFERADQR